MKVSDTMEKEYSFNLLGLVDVKDNSFTLEIPVALNSYTQEILPITIITKNKFTSLSTDLSSYRTVSAIRQKSEQFAKSIKDKSSSDAEYLKDIFEISCLDYILYQGTLEVDETDDELFFYLIHYNSFSPNTIIEDKFSVDTYLSYLGFLPVTEDEDVVLLNIKVDLDSFELAIVDKKFMFPVPNTNRLEVDDSLVVSDASIQLSDSAINNIKGIANTLLNIRIDASDTLTDVYDYQEERKMLFGDIQILSGQLNKPISLDEIKFLPNEELENVINLLEDTLEDDDEMSMLEDDSELDDTKEKGEPKNE